MKKIKFLMMAFAILVGLMPVMAQIDKGFIKMEITDIQSENEQMMAMADMFKSSFTEIYFTPEKAYTKVNMMSGMNITQVLMDLKTEENIMLMSMMGQKFKINMDEEELEEMQSGQQAKVEYNRFPDETKDILGFKCYKVELAGDAATQGAQMTIWVTDDIHTSAHVTSGIQTNELKGFPLEYKMSMAGQMELTMKATEFEKDFDESVFNVSTEGYKEMTLDEFMQSMGGMGGM